MKVKRARLTERAFEASYDHVETATHPFWAAVDSSLNGMYVLIHMHGVS